VTAASAPACERATFSASHAPSLGQASSKLALPPSKPLTPARSRTGSKQSGTSRSSDTASTGPASSPSTAPARSTSARSSSNPGNRKIVGVHPWEFIRGLIHSDGCRITNWTEKVIAGERKRYEYPRYFFTNVSDDIRQLYTDTLDKLGIQWTHCTRNGNPFNISVARKASVALMDAHVGPKY
jgi:hypothetical protein